MTNRQTDRQTDRQEYTEEDTETETGRKTIMIRKSVGSIHCSFPRVVIFFLKTQSEIDKRHFILRGILTFQVSLEVRVVPPNC